MQDYISLAQKNGITLLDQGPCQFCGAKTKRGIHECLEIFSFELQGIDFSSPENHIYRFLIVDAHALQHPEIHGRWSNHFDLCRLNLIFEYQVSWTYAMSPRLSDYLNNYKINKPDELMVAPNLKQRGQITSTDILSQIANENESKNRIKKWALEVYNSWCENHSLIQDISNGFLKSKG